MTAEDKAVPAVRRWRKRLILASLLVFALALGYYTIVFEIGSNFRVVVPDAVYRSAQPSPAQLRDWVNRYHIATIISLRGDAGAETAREKALVQEMHVTFTSIRMSAYEEPSRPALVALIDALESSDVPVLIHCSHGVDRSGTASAIAAMALGKADYQSAGREISIFPGPWRKSPSGEHISDLFKSYEAWCDRHDLPADAWPRFKKWALEIYHPLYYFVEIDAPGEIRLPPGQSAHEVVTVTNKSRMTIPASDPTKVFEIIAYTGTPVYDRNTCTLLGPPERLGGRDIPPAASASVLKTITAPAVPGRYDIFFDVMDRTRSSFGTQGSPTFASTLIVEPEPPPEIQSPAPAEVPSAD